MKFILEMIPHRGAIYAGYELQDMIRNDGYEIHNEEHSRYGFPCFEYYVDLPEEQLEAFKLKHQAAIDANPNN